MKKWLAQKSTRAGFATLIAIAAGYFSGQVQEAAAILGAGSALGLMVYPEGRKSTKTDAGV